ncbi:MAG: acylneuraminate cytidylyltransferase [Hyphococcus sp.]|nr:MAG: acylneuraminate cytidylyltransferase [Marinicaulis sp.]
MTRTVAFVLARSGSKGLPGKNIKPLAGKPLLVWSVEAALSCPEVDEVIVSTDGEDIAEAGRAAGAQIMMRPATLASDTAPPKEAIRYHIDEIKPADRPDIIVLLQPTSPLRAVKDISACVISVRDHGNDSCATFIEAPGDVFRAWKKTDKGMAPLYDGHDPWARRQDLPAAFVLNGAVYAVRAAPFLADHSINWLPGKSDMTVMPAERSIDIDTALDFDFAELVISRGGETG